MAAGCRGGGGRLQDDQFDVDAEFHAACALVQLQQFLARFERQYRIGITRFRLAVCIGIAKLTGEYGLAVVE